MEAEKDEVAMLAAFEHCSGQGWVGDGVIAQGEGQAAQLWRLREDITESLVRHEPYKNDVSVRSEEHTSELQSLMRISYAVFCLKKKKSCSYTDGDDTQTNIRTS